MYRLSALNKSKYLHPVGILLLGLVLAQAIATTQVYLSNVNLYATVSAVKAAGYLSIPNERVMSRLLEFYPAFLGGFFFTFTIGAGLSLVSMATASIWARWFQRRRSVLFLLLAAWTGLLMIVNSSGLSLMPTLYFLLIIPAVFTLTLKCEAGPASQPDRFRQLAHFIPLPVLALLWFTQFDGTMFLDLRDNLLLSNVYGRKLTQFYYNYTLYPAQAFKALSQKTIKTSRIESAQSYSPDHKIDDILLAHDYLPLSDTSKVDLVIHQADDLLEFQKDYRQIFQIPLDRFLAGPQVVLQKFSAQCDRNSPFRGFTFLFLLIGFPASIYLVVHALLHYLGLLVLSRRTAALVATIICLLIGIVALVYFQANRSRNIQIINISQALTSDRWQDRIAALKLIEQKKLEIAGYPNYPHRLDTLEPQEKYWLVRTLAFSRRPETFKKLLEYLEDDNLNVRTMALYALGLRRDPRALPPILAKLEASTSWYEQMYAYKALRSLGWKQTRSR